MSLLASLHDKCEFILPYVGYLFKINGIGKFLKIYVEILDQCEPMKCLGFRYSEVNICYELTGNDFERLQ